MRKSARIQADVVKYKRAIRTIGPRPLRYYGNGIPYLKETEIKGRLVVIEGPDASGRNTPDWKFNNSFRSKWACVLNTGLRRFDLIASWSVRSQKKFRHREKNIKSILCCETLQINLKIK